MQTTAHVTTFSAMEMPGVWTTQNEAQFVSVIQGSLVTDSDASERVRIRFRQRFMMVKLGTDCSNIEYIFGQTKLYIRINKFFVMVLLIYINSYYFIVIF